MMPNLRCLIALTLLTTISGKPATAQDDSLPTDSGRRQNVLLIIVDDLGFGDLSCQGADDLRTPEIDRLFADSLKFDRLYANCPVCSPTRASVLTGCYPDRVGVPGVIRTHASNSWGYFAPTTPTLSERLSKMDYHTAAIGKWHLGLRDENHPESRGFDFFKGFLGDMMDDYYHHRRHDVNYMRDGRKVIDPEGHATDLFSQWAVDYITDRGSKGDQPWFLYLAYNAPHTPIQPPKDWLAKVQKRQPGISDRRAALVALIEHMDAGIGEVLESLRQTDQYKDTLIIFTSDNGGQLNVGANNGPLRDGKQSMYEGGLRIPGCIRVPGRTRPGSHTEARCLTMDLLPTVIELVSGQPYAPDGIDGISLAEQIDDPQATLPVRDTYFVRREGGTRYAGLTIEAVLHGNYKLVHNLPTGKLELFDIANDPAETNDLSAKLPKVFREMVSRLQRHIQRGGQVPWQKFESVAP